MLPSKIGPITGYVNDFSGVVSLEKLSEINTLFEKFQADTGKQVVTVIFPHREGKELIDIGVELFNHVGIGEKGINNGLLLLISSEEKKLRIIVGKGLEFIYPEEWCRAVIENHLRPLLNDEKFDELVETWYAYLDTDYHTPRKHSNFKKEKYYYPQAKKTHKYNIVSIIGVILLLIFLIIQGNRGEQRFCEQRPTSCINGKIDHASQDYKDYKHYKNPSRNNHGYNNSSSRSSESSSSRSSSNFSGGGGSTNGAGWGD